MKNFKTIISLVLAIVLVVTALPVMALGAEKGDVNGDGKITAVDARIILQIIAHIADDKDIKNPNEADYDGDGSVTAIDARKVLQKVANIVPDKPISDMTKAEIAELFNRETVKASNGTYNWKRKCDFSKPIDAGSATETLNKIISMIDANASLDSVVGGFLGVGNDNGTQDDAGKYAIIATKLTADDIKSLAVSEDKISVVLNDSENPTGDGKTSFEHVSNDFITKVQVSKEIENAVGTMMAVNSLNTKYYDVTLVAELKNGAPDSLTISYKLSAEMKLKAASVNVNGNGEITTEIIYTDLEY